MTTTKQPVQPVLTDELRAALEIIGGELQTSGQKTLRHIETAPTHPDGGGVAIASGNKNNSKLLNAICTVCNEARSLLSAQQAEQAEQHSLKVRNFSSPTGWTELYGTKEDCIAVQKLIDGAEQADAKDAERYRFMRDDMDCNDIEYWAWCEDIDIKEDDFIDELMAKHARWEKERDAAISMQTKEQ